MGTIKDRLYETMELLGVNDYKVYTSVEGVTKNMMSKLRTGETGEVSTKIIAPFCTYYENVNPDYLLTGRGTPLKEMKVTEIYRPKGREKKEEEGKIILYDIEAAANLQHLFAHRRENILGEIKIPHIPACDGAVYVRGDSMYPLLKSGDIVAYKIIPLDTRHILFGEMYLVSLDMEGDEYLAVKYVNHSEKGEDWIKLVSYNVHHQPKDFPLSAVRAMALVKLSIRMNTMK